MSFGLLAAKDRRVYMQSHSPQSQSRSDCYPILLNMQSHSREATGTVTPFDKYAESKSRSDCYPILLNMQRHSREATVMPRRRGEAASFY